MVYQNTHNYYIKYNQIIDHPSYSNPEAQQIFCLLVN